MNHSESSVWEAVELLKVSALAQMARDLIEEGNSVVIFTNYVATLEALCSALDTTSAIYGTTSDGKAQSAEARQAIIEHFQADLNRIVIVNIAAGGVGVSLHDLHGTFPRVSLNNLIILLPSGRTLKYRKIERNKDGDITGVVMKSGRPIRVRLYGALIVENVIQAIARDVFAEGVLRLDDAGIPVVVHIHDEAVTECPASVPAETVGSILAQPPAWLPDLPVASEAESHAYYTK